MSVKAWDSSICWLKDAHPRPNQPYFSIPRQSDVILNPIRCLGWQHQICWGIPSVLESNVSSVLPQGPHLEYWQFLGPLFCLPEFSPASSMSFPPLDYFTQQKTEVTISGYSLLGPPYTHSRGRVELTSVLRFKVPPVLPQGPCLDSWQVLELLSLLIWRHITLSKPHFPETFIFYFPRRKSEASTSLWLGAYGADCRDRVKLGPLSSSLGDSFIAPSISSPWFVTGPETLPSCDLSLSPSSQGSHLSEDTQGRLKKAYSLTALPGISHSRYQE